MSGRLWDQIKARALRLAARAAEREARRIARRLEQRWRQGIPPVEIDVTPEPEGAAVTVSGPGLALQAESDPALRFAGRDGAGGAGDEH
ncbi:hypothetical protein GV829_07905 [Sphingomonas lacunae]|uniref:Uncharacterized protein n=1 Tax=Sphingomonas lacunae TaxID=2698828 RepID=A0A6M4ATG4_9SPHN|nr:hypothetical protein [Sphingomonas lacunae]QJQ32383.1 hypothetical protein GV829_07905 [Sphingomonas lacunae]